MSSLATFIYPANALVPIVVPPSPPYPKSNLMPVPVSIVPLPDEFPTANAVLLKVPTPTVSNWAFATQ